jgi:ketosteroid isomerase-like protein
MNSTSSATEAVVRRHLTAFVEARGADAIVADYGGAAHFHTEAEVYVGRQEIRGFFERFIEALPAGGIDRFELRTLQVDGGLAFITWNVGSDIPLGTDTFVVADGQIVAQTFAMHPAPAPAHQD